MNPLPALLILAAACGAPGCGRSALAGGFDAPVPAARIDAIRRSVRDGDRSATTLRRLVEQLDSDDAAVRFAAIAALRRRTAETHGYRYDDPPAVRGEAIERWLADPRLAAPAAAAAEEARPSPPGAPEHG